MVKVFCLIYNSPIAQHDAIYNTIWCDFKLVWTCQNLFEHVIAQHDSIYDTIWYDFKLVWTCPKLQYDKILLNLM